jgi:transposase
MGYFAGLDVSLEMTSVCLINAAGKVVSEGKVPSEPAEVVRPLADLGRDVERVGLEAGPLSEWIAGGLLEAGVPAVCMEARQVKAALSAMTVKTDRHDARGIAQSHGYRTPNQIRAGQRSLAHPPPANLPLAA